MGKGIIEWIIVPQVVGAIFIIAGLIQKTWPPKNINGLYGYHMPSSKQNQETWDEANRYSARYMIEAGIFLLIVGIIVTVLLNIIPMPVRIKEATWYLLMLASSMGSGISMIVSTGKHMDKTFGDKK